MPTPTAESTVGTAWREQPVQPAVRNPASPGISYRVTVCVHAPMQFRGVDIGAPGGDSQPARWLGVLTSIADRRITPRRARVPAVSAPSSIRRAAPRVQYHGVGDDAFPLSPYTEAFSSRRRLDWPARTIAEPSYCDTFAGAVPGTNSCAGRGSSSSACSANSNVNGQSLVLRRWLTWF